MDIRQIHKEVCTELRERGQLRSAMDIGGQIFKITGTINLPGIRRKLNRIGLEARMLCDDCSPAGTSIWFCEKGNEEDLEFYIRQEKEELDEVA